MKQNYLDDTQDTLISDRVGFKFVVSLLVSFHEEVYGAPAGSHRSVLVVHRNSQNIVLGNRFLHLSLILDRRNSFIFNINSKK